MNLEDFNFDALPSRINIPRELEPSIWIDRQTDIGFTRYFFLNESCLKRGKLFL